MWRRLPNSSGEIRRGAIALRSKPPLVTQIARTGLGARLTFRDPPAKRLRNWPRNHPYWWRVTSKIWAVLLIGRSKFSTKQKHYTGGWNASSMSLLAMYPFLQSEASPSHSHLFSRVTLAWLLSTPQMGSLLYGLGKPVVASRNVSCFLRLPKWKIP